MVTKIRKRDGSVVPFNKDKISEAIWKAVKAVGGTDKERTKEILEIVVKYISNKHKENEIPEVEEVQDAVEKILIEEGHAKVAKAYILYRKSHEELRDVKGLFDTIEAVDDYIGMNDWMIKENSNKSFSLQGLNNYIATKIISNYWMRRIYPEAIRKVHENGNLHLHDLDTLGAYCFDDKTKILTESGWKFFKDVKNNEKVATKNLKTGELEFQIPYAKQIYDYDGEMYSFEGRSVSLLVTPEHRLLIRRKGKKVWEFVNPPEFRDGMEFDKKLSWKGKKTKSFIIPSVKGGNRKKIIGNFKIQDYVEFMGWYISEGSVYEPAKGDYRISIAQSEKRYRGEICRLLKKMNLSHNIQSEFNIHLHSKDLFYHLKILGKSNEKYIPNEIKSLEPELIEKFLIALFKGDGSFSDGKLYKYYTNSKKLAEDVIECLLKIGLCGTLWQRKDNNIFVIDVQHNHLTPIYRKKILKKKYKGKVYDFSVPNSTLVVMREGKVVISGNCVGWDLKDLLLQGFKGVSGKVVCGPPKHLSSALGQMVNFFYTLQGETAGAQAFSNFDSLLAPFVRYDSLDYKGVKACMQSFLFNMAVPTRVGFQCMSEDTEILTPNGWANYETLKKGDTIKTFNIDKKIIEDKPIKNLFKREYKGLMYNLKNRIQDQLISPNHRVVYKFRKNEEYKLIPIEKIKDKQFYIPTTNEKKINYFEDSLINEIKKINYEGIIWCPNTDNETVIARRNGKVFITGNTPFTNITMDLKVPGYMKDEPVIVGGKPQRETYKEFQDEMDTINKAFAECMMEGDANGNVFTFPIPTYNITKDFDWDSTKYDMIWEMTAKYGIPYFSNFINSDMNPEDARSMCPLAGDEKVLIKSSRGRKLEFGEIKNIFRGNSKKEEYEIYSDGKFVKGRFNSFKNQKMIKVVLENNHELKISEAHLNFVKKGKNSNQVILEGKELEKGMYLPYSLNIYNGEGGDKNLGFFVGAYAGDGSYDGETGVVFSLEGNYKKELITKIKKISENYFGANCSVIESKKSKLVTLRVNSRAAVGLCRDFVEGKEREKHYKARLFGMGEEFRRGVIEGHYATDGGNRNRIYTSSKKMVESLNMLAATLGTTTSIYKDEREGRLGKEPNYAVLIYQLNRKNYGDIWFKDSNRIWVKIKEIKKLINTTAYCFEVSGGEPVFTVGTTGILTHNCRLRLDQTELRKRGGGLFGANPLTGSIGVVTLNMPRIGFTATDEDDFLKKVESLMDLAKESLEIKRKTIERFTEMGLYPYSKFYLKTVHQRFGEYWKNHFATIGLLGMNEAIMNFMPGENIATERGMEFALKIMDFMRAKLEEFQEETGNIYNLEATPGEGTSYKFAREDKKRLGRIIVANERYVQENKAKPFYTNSTQLPVDYTDDLFYALELQDKLQVKYTGGTVFHTYVGERLPKEAVKILVKKIAEKFNLPYFTITPTFSICPIHGYLSGEHDFCPICDKEHGIARGKNNEIIKQVESHNRRCKMEFEGTKCEIFSRVVGYIRPVQQWNEGKSAEFQIRKTFNVSGE